MTRVEQSSSITEVGRSSIAPDQGRFTFALLVGAAAAAVAFIWVLFDLWSGSLSLTRVATSAAVVAVTWRGAHPGDSPMAIIDHLHLGSGPAVGRPCGGPVAIRATGGGSDMALCQLRVHG